MGQQCEHNPGQANSIHCCEITVTIKSAVRFHQIKRASTCMSAPLKTDRTAPAASGSSHIRAKLHKLRLINYLAGAAGATPCEECQVRSHCDGNYQRAIMSVDHAYHIGIAWNVFLQQEPAAIGCSDPLKAGSEINRFIDYDDAFSSALRRGLDYEREGQVRGRLVHGPGSRNDVWKQIRKVSHKSTFVTQYPESFVWRSEQSNVR